MERVVEKIENQHEEDEADIFGKYVASNFRKLTSVQAIYAKKIINDALYYAEMQGLNITSRIETENFVLHVPESPE